MFHQESSVETIKSYKYYVFEIQLEQVNKLITEIWLTDIN